MEAPAPPLTHSTSERRASGLPRNVYDPDQPVSRRTLVAVVALAVVVLAVIAVLVVRELTTERVEEPVPGVALVFERGIRPLPNGWSQLDVEAGTAVVELPGPLLRSRADLVVEGVGTLPMAVWGNGTEEGDVYGLAVGQVPDGWSTRRDELLQRVPLPLGLEIEEAPRRAFPLAGNPAVEIGAAGEGRLVRALAVASPERVIIVLYGGTSPERVNATMQRITASLELG